MRRGWAGEDIVVNVQGDEPLMPPALIGQVAGLLAATPGAAIATLATPIVSEAEYLDPNVVKVVARPDGMALYFSRAPIPWDRDGRGANRSRNASPFRGSRRHLGLYAYRVAALLAARGRGAGRDSSGANGSNSCARSRWALPSSSRMRRSCRAGRRHARRPRARGCDSCGRRGGQ